MPAVKPFDTSFSIGLVFVAASLAVAWWAIANGALPLVGGGRGPLIAVAVVGMAGCAIAGVGQAPTAGWTHPVIIVGSVLGVVALAIIGAGLFGWDGVVRPIARIAPGGALVSATTEQLAVVAIAGLIAVKFVVNLASALVRST